MCIKWTIVKDIRSVAPRVKICKPFFFFVFGTQKGGRAPRRSQRRPWKMGIRIVTTFILCKWDSWWACGLFSAMIKVVRVVDHVLAFCQWCNFSPNQGPWFSCLHTRVLKSKYPEEYSTIDRIEHEGNPVWWCIEALRFSECWRNYWNSTVNRFDIVDSLCCIF